MSDAISVLIRLVFQFSDCASNWGCEVKVPQLCLTLCDSTDHTVHGILLLARILEWVAIPFSRGSSQARDRTQVSRIAGGFFTSWGTRDIIQNVSFSGAASDREPACWCRRHRRLGFNPSVGKFSRRRKWQPTPVFLPRKSHGQRSLQTTVHGVTELDMTEATLEILKEQKQVSFFSSLRSFQGKYWSLPSLEYQALLICSNKSAGCILLMFKQGPVPVISLIKCFPRVVLSSLWT